MDESMNQDLGQGMDQDVDGFDQFDRDGEDLLAGDDLQDADAGDSLAGQTVLDEADLEDDERD